MEKTPEDKAFDKACGFLSYRQRSVEEINKYLDKRGFSEYKKTVVDRLSGVGLLDDRVFAESWVRERSAGRGYGSRRLRMELARLGIDRILIEETITREYPSESESECAIRLALNKANKLPDGKEDNRQRVYGFLVRRGFPSHIAKEAVDSAFKTA